MHDLIYLWDFGDAASGDWTAPEKILPEWKNRNVAKGPMVTHMYTRPGTYSASVLIIEPDSGKTATAALDIVVGDPDTLYSGATGSTVFYNEHGDNDWTWVDANYPGATKVNIPADGHLIWNSDISMDGVTEGRHDAEWSTYQDGKPRRCLFKAGSDLKFSIALDGADYRGLFIGTYGLGDISNDKAILRHTGLLDEKGRGIGAGIINQKGTGYSGQGDTPPGDLRIHDIQMLGVFDPENEITPDVDFLGNTGLAIRATFRMDLMLSRVDFDGFSGGVVSWTMPTDNGHIVKAVHLHLDDCTNTNFGAYSIYPSGATTNPKSTFSVTGCRIAQNPLGLEYDGTRSPIRDGSIPNVHMRGNDMFHTISTYTHVKVANTPRENGYIVNIHSNSFEGGYQAVIIAGNVESSKGSDPGKLPNTSGTSPVLNVVIDGNIHIADYGTKMSYYTQASGYTLRNNLTVVSGKAANNAFQYFFEVKARDQPDSDGGAEYDRTVVGDAPIKIYNNTLRVERSSAQNKSESLNSYVPQEIRNWSVNDAPNFTNVQMHNNLIHMPNLDSPVTTYGPLTSNVLFTPRGVGRREAFSNHSHLLTFDVVDGADLFVPYWLLSDWTTYITRANIKEADSRHRLDTAYFRKKDITSGDFEMSFSDTGMTITNRSGVTWETGTYVTVRIACIDRAALEKPLATPADAWLDSRPAVGSAALGAALNGEVSYMDIMLENRPEPPSIGAWEAE
ncbi:PKD domain-containing protein [Rhodobacteraceae bacterium F11138]|nr:PKD domain-containing protein [Rhodobacteraceae bacterium F11138]